MHVWSEDMGVHEVAADVGQETHEVHDQLAVYRDGIEEEMRRIPRPSTSDRWESHGRGKVPTGPMPSDMQRHHEGEDAEANRPEGRDGGR